MKPFCSTYIRMFVCHERTTLRHDVRLDCSHGLKAERRLKVVSSGTSLVLRVTMSGDNCLQLRAVPSVHLLPIK